MCVMLVSHVEFSFETLSLFLSNPFNLGNLWKKYGKRDRSKGNGQAREDHNFERLIDLKCKMVLCLSRVAWRCRKGGRRREEEIGPLRMRNSIVWGRKRKRWLPRAVITQEIKMSRILHEAAVRNSTVSRTSRKMCRSFLSRELCVLTAAVVRIAHESPQISPYKYIYYEFFL